MSKKITSLVSCEPSQEFGKKGERQMRNLVVHCQFGTSDNSLFRVTGSGNIFTANLTIPEEYYEKYDSNADKCIAAYAKELKTALKEGDFVLYGHLVSVSELTDGEHESVYNKSTKHTIETFAQALETDDVEEAKSFVRRALIRRIEQKAFLWKAPED